jgi:hypothetical protein
VDPHRALDLSLQELVYAGLDALLAMADLDVCAYLHDSDETGPQLFLGAPTLADAKSPKAFGLFADLSTALERAHGDGTGTGPTVADELVGGVRCVLVTTVGRNGRGVHAVGRRADDLSDATRAAMVRLATALGTAVHRLQWAATPASGR